MITRVIIPQIVSERDDSCSPTLRRGYINAQVAQIAHKGGGEGPSAALMLVLVLVLVFALVFLLSLPLGFFLVEPPFGFCIQLLLVPHLASAVLPTRRALVAEFGAASAGDVVAPEGEFDYCPTAWTPLPVVLLEEVIDHSAFVHHRVVALSLSVARRVPWMGGLLASCAEETMAGWASHLTLECLH